MGPSRALAILVATSAVCGGAARAQREGWRVSFQEGLSALHAGDVEAAVQRFSAAYAEHPSAGIAANLAGALELSGQHARAHRRAREALRLDPRPDAERMAEDLIGRVAPRIGRLRVVVANPDPADRLSLDGEPVALEFADDWAVEPGDHTLVIRRGDSSERHAVTARAGERVELSVGATLGLERAGGDEGEPGAAGQWWLWAAVGGGAALLFGVVLAVALGRRTDDPVRGNADPPFVEWP